LFRIFTGVVSRVAVHIEEDKEKEENEEEEQCLEIPGFIWFWQKKILLED
jgi:hypothetical protein